MLRKTERWYVEHEEIMKAIMLSLSLLIVPSLHGGEAERCVTAHFEKSDIKEALRAVAAQGQINVAVSPRFLGSVSGSFESVPAEAVLDSLVRQIGGHWRRDGNVILVDAGPAKPGASGRRSATRMPFFGGPGSSRSPAIVDPPPFRADELPYVGERVPQMPKSHFANPAIPDEP